jgi:hypothetical protein
VSGAIVEQLSQFFHGCLGAPSLFSGKLANSC